MIWYWRSLLANSRTKDAGSLKLPALSTPFDDTWDIQAVGLIWGVERRTSIDPARADNSPAFPLITLAWKVSKNSKRYVNYHPNLGDGVEFSNLSPSLFDTTSRPFQLGQRRSAFCLHWQNALELTWSPTTLEWRWHICTSTEYSRFDVWL